MITRGGWGLGLALGVVLLGGCTPPESPDEEPTAEASEALLPPGCPRNARVFTYDPVGWEHLANAFAANPAPCADYYLHLPAIAGDKKTPRGSTAVDGIHALGDHFHALAEFHWTTWSQSSSLSWHDKGVEFRRRMQDAGYVAGRDAWAINELPSTVRTDSNVRAHVRSLVQGLYDGPSGSAKMGGLVFIVGMGSSTSNFSVYKPALEDWLSDGDFWDQMNLHVRWWGQEVYPDPLDSCVTSATVATRAQHLSDYAMHPALLASAGPSSAARARSFFDESYTPILSAAFRSEDYNTTTISLDNMEKFVSTELYAARTFANDHTSPDWRVGLAWNEHPDGVSDATLTALAERIAAAVHDAYPDDGSSASRICGASGAFTLCHCNMSAASFNSGWSSFTSW